MALDDFDDDDDQLDGAAGLVGGIDPNDPLDEDLFAFPPPESIAEHHEYAAPAPVEAAAPTQPRAALPADVGTSPTPPSTLMAGAAPAAAGAASAGPEVDHDTPPTSPQSPFHDPQLDVDLFDFSELFAGGPAAEHSASQPEPPPPPVVEAPPVAAASAPAPAPTRAPAPGAQTAPAASPAPAASAPAPSAPTAFPAPAASPASAAPAPAAPAASPVTDDGAPLQDWILRTPPPPLVTAAAPRTRTLELLAVLFLVVNTGLILFAWQANSSFHDTLTEVTRTVSDTLASQASAGPATTTVYVPQVSQVPIASPSIDEAPSDVTGLQLQSVELSRRMLSEGRFMDARQTLYRLLASADAAGIESRLVTEAEYLIAESYELQARALAEEER